MTPSFDPIDELAHRLFMAHPRDIKVEPVTPAERRMFPHERCKWMAQEIRKFIKEHRQ